MKTTDLGMTFKEAFICEAERWASPLTLNRKGFPLKSDLIKLYGNLPILEEFTMAEIYSLPHSRLGYKSFILFTRNSGAELMAAQIDGVTPKLLQFIIDLKHFNGIPLKQCRRTSIDGSYLLIFDYDDNNTMDEAIDYPISTIIHSLNHIRYEGGYEGKEYSPNHSSRAINLAFSDNKQFIKVSITPTLTTKSAILQNDKESEVLKYIGDDPDYVFYVRNKEKIKNCGSFFSSSFMIAFNDDDLQFILYRRDRDLIIEYYK